MSFLESLLNKTPTIEDEVNYYRYLLLGGSIVKETSKNGDPIISSGLQKINEFIYTTGDCGRFALLLFEHFQKYKPTLIRIQFTDETSFHWLTKIGDKCWDAKGYTPYENILSKYPEGCTKQEFTEVPIQYYNTELTAHFAGYRLIQDIVCLGAVAPMFSIVVQKQPDGSFDFKGINSDRLYFLNKWFNQLHKDMKKGDLKDSISLMHSMNYYQDDDNKYFAYELEKE